MLVRDVFVEGSVIENVIKDIAKLGMAAACPIECTQTSVTCNINLGEFFAGIMG